MKITLKEFQELSTRTAPHNADPQNHIEKQYLLTNYVLGLNGEFLEWSLERYGSENYVKELGDVLHYAVILLKTLGNTVTDANVGLSKPNKKEAKYALSDSLEIIKKTYYHGHEFEEVKFIKAVKKVIDYVYAQAGEEVFYEALELNIEKLKKRYPNGFNHDDSVARIDQSWKY